MLRSAESISPLGKKFPSFEVRGDQRTHSLARSFVVNLILFEMKAEIFKNLNKAMADIYLPRDFPACALRLEATNGQTPYVVNFSFWKWKEIQCSGVLRIYLPREFQACAFRLEASNGLARVRLRSIYDF